MMTGSPLSAIRVFCLKERPHLDSGSLHASQTLARSAYAALKKGFSESFTAPLIIPCALLSASANFPIVSLLFIFHPLIHPIQFPVNRLRHLLGKAPDVGQYGRPVVCDRRLPCTIHSYFTLPAIGDRLQVVAITCQHHSDTAVSKQAYSVNFSREH